MRVALAFLQGIGIVEILVIALIVLLLFGATKLPQLAHSLGRAKSEFKRGEREALRDLDDEEALRKRARELGIATEGKTLDELRREVRARQGS